MIKYHRLFSVKFFHEFSESYHLQDFDIVVTPQTQWQIKSLQLIYKSTGEGFEILYKEDKKGILENLKEELSFTFGLKVKNRYFASFTDVQTVDPVKKYYLSNQEIKNQGFEGQKILHAGGFLDKNNVCLCCFGDSNMESIFSEEEFTIKRKEEVFFEGKFQRWHNAAGVFRDNYGRFSVTPQDSSDLIDLYYSEPILSGTFGIIELSLGGDQTKFENTAGSVYEVRFKNRSVQWVYYLVGAERSFDSIEIFKAKEKLLFSDPEEVVLVNGKEAVKLKSLRPVPLKKWYNGSQIYALTIESPVDDNPAIKRKIDLPTPNIQRIKGTVSDDVETYYADMYVNL